VAEYKMPKPLLQADDFCPKGRGVGFFYCPLQLD